MIFIAVGATVLLLGAAAFFLVWVRRRDRQIKELTERLEHFQIYPDSSLPEPVGETLREGDLQNLINQISRLEQLLLHQRRSALEREGQMIRFTENMAHQMKNALAAAQIQLDILEAAVPETGRESMEKCQAGMERLNSELDRVLRSSQLAEGKATMSFEPVDLRAELEVAREHILPLAGLKNVELQAEGPELTVSADCFWLGEALENLIKNAVEHSPAGATVTARLADEGTRARLTVSDRGPGIADGEFSALFERFRRGDNAKAGYGVGLPMARDVARAHHGELTAKNLPEGGAVFELTLPIFDGSRPYGDHTPR